MKHNMKCLVLLDIVRTRDAREGNSSKRNSKLNLINFLSNKHAMIMIGIEISWQLYLMFAALRIAILTNVHVAFNLAVVPLV